LSTNIFEFFCFAPLARLAWTRLLVVIGWWSKIAYLDLYKNKKGALKTCFQQGLGCACTNSSMLWVGIVGLSDLEIGFWMKIQNPVLQPPDDRTRLDQNV